LAAALNGRAAEKMGWEQIRVTIASEVLKNRIQNISSHLVTSKDPNDKTGPAGFGPQGFIPAGGNPMTYTIYFENTPTASAAACDVTIDDPLNANLDGTSLELLDVCFGSYHVTIPAGMSHYDDSIGIDGWTYNPTQGWHTGETPLKVNISAGIDIATGKITWTLSAVDPTTGLPPQDGYAGFLPPDDPQTSRGQGFVTYLLKQKPSLVSGTQITNKASIVFDANPAIDTPQTLNTIDAAAPTSKVNTLPDVAAGAAIQVTWTGQDEPAGSGIAFYDIYVSPDGGPYGLWQNATMHTSATFTGQVGHSYRFYSLATDNVGHRQAAPAPDWYDASVTLVHACSSLCIDGPSTLLQGESRAYTATATYDDGLIADVTAGATWIVASGIGSFSAPGVYASPATVSADMPVTLKATYTEAGVSQQATANLTIKAASKLTYTLSVQTNTGSQASIDVTGPNGLTTSSLTNFSQEYDADSSVTITAPEALGDEHFVKWMLDGNDYSTDLAATVQIDSAHTLVAIYEPTTGKSKCGASGSDNLPIFGLMCFLGLMASRRFVSTHR
jgi:hypothetical protein